MIACPQCGAMIGASKKEILDHTKMHTPGGLPSFVPPLPFKARTCKACGYRKTPTMGNVGIHDKPHGRKTWLDSTRHRRVYKSAWSDPTAAHPFTPKQFEGVEFDNE